MSETGEALTFLFTDIEGSTRMWAAEPAAMNAALAAHDRLLAEAIRTHGGQVFKTVGDAFCAAFDQAEGALAAALALQRAVLAEAWPPETPIRVRAAVHSGPCIRRDDDYFGPTLNRTARVLGVAAGGQTLLTEATHEALGERAAAWSLRSLGAVRLKDLAEPTVVYQLEGPGLPSDFPPLRSLDTLPTNLPVRAAGFVGRAEALRELAALSASRPLVTLVGPGGIGKTSLALQVAAGALDELPDGAWFVDLAPVESAEGVPDAVAGALGLREEPARTLEETLLAWLKARRLVLVLDNCEHLLAACARLTGRLLGACPGLRILATSREALNVAGELAWPVPPLPLPAEGGQAPADLAANEAVGLFVDRARSALPGFTLTAENAADVAAICRRLDGIPLALELAAARVRVLPPAALLGRLDDRFRLLTGGRRDALPRQQTLRAAIDWSYDLLGEPERRLLARLSVFRGAWPLEAAEAICADEDLDALDVLDGVTRLVERSLVANAGDPAEARFRLLETMRHYAREKLPAGGGWEPLRRRHRDWYRALAREGAAGLRGPDQTAWLSRLAREHDDLVAAMDRATRAGDGAGALALGASLWRFWYLRGHLGEGRRYLAAALATAPASEDAATSADRAEALHGAASLAGLQGDYAAARALHRDCLGLRRAAGDRVGEAASLNNLAIVAYQTGDYVGARDLYRSSLEVKRDLGDRRGIANSLNNLALVAKATGDLPAAAKLYEETRGLYEALGDATGIAQTLVNSASLAIEVGEYDRARTCLAQGLTICEQTGDRARAALTRYLQARVAYCDDRLAEARALCTASMAEERSLGNAAGVHRCEIQLAQIALSEGDPGAALELLERSLAGLEALGDRHGMADALCELGRVHVRLGDLAAARDLFGRGLVLLHSTGRTGGTLYAIEWLAGVAIAVGHPAPALELLTAAAAERHRLGVVAEPIHAREVAADRAAAVAALGEPAAKAAIARGLEMPRHIAVARALALGSGEPTSPPPTSRR